MVGNDDRPDRDIHRLYASGRSFVDAAEAAHARGRASGPGPPSVPVILLAALGAGMMLRCALAIEGKTLAGEQNHFRLFSRLSPPFKTRIVSRYMTKHREQGGGGSVTRNGVLKRIRRHGGDVRDWRDVGAIERRRSRPVHHLVLALALRELIADEYSLFLR